MKYKIYIIIILLAQLIVTFYYHNKQSTMTSYFASTSLGSCGINSVIANTGIFEVYQTLPEAIAFSQNTDQFGTNVGVNAWQSFTAPFNGLITEVFISMQLVSGAAPTTFNIWLGNGTGGAVLHTQSVTFRLGTGAFRLSVPLSVTAGQIYTMGSIATSDFFARYVVAVPAPYVLSSLGAPWTMVNYVKMIQRNSLLFISNTANPLISIGSNTPSTSGCLDINSTTGALIVPRMTTVQKNALTAVNGMIVYDTTLNAFSFRENGVWVAK